MPRQPRELLLGGGQRLALLATPRVQLVDVCLNPQGISGDSRDRVSQEVNMRLGINSAAWTLLTVSGCFAACTLASPLCSAQMVERFSQVLTHERVIIILSEQVARVWAHLNPPGCNYVIAWSLGSCQLTSW